MGHANLNCWDFGKEFSMSSERLIAKEGLPSDEPWYGSTATLAWSGSFIRCGENDSIFEELPKATIVSVSRPDTGDMSPMLLSYTIEVQYKQFKWRLLKKASQVLYLHFALKKRALIEEFHEKQEQVLPFPLHFMLFSMLADLFIKFTLSFSLHYSYGIG